MFNTEFMKRVIIDNEQPEKVRGDIAEFRREYQKVHYCFDNLTEAYAYIKVK